MELRLNGDILADRQQLHKEIARQLQLPEYYGENLDALWDILTEWNQPLQIIVEKSDVLTRQLGGYGEMVLQLFQELNDMGNTILMITHDQNVGRKAKQIVQIVDGRLYTENSCLESSVIRADGEIQHA